jgi:platelet-activating factor acetylhydrolase
MKLVTGTTLDSRTALREYIDTSVRFLQYLKTQKKTGMLESEVTSTAGPLGDAEKRHKAKGQFGADWEVHVVPKSY